MHCQFFTRICGNKQILIVFLISVAVLVQEESASSSPPPPPCVNKIVIQKVQQPAAAAQDSDTDLLELDYYDSPLYDMVGGMSDIQVENAMGITRRSQARRYYDALSGELPLLFPRHTIFYEAHRGNKLECGLRDAARLYKIDRSMLVKQTTCNHAMYEYNMTQRTASAVEAGYAVRVVANSSYLHPSRKWSLLYMHFEDISSVAGLFATRRALDFVAPYFLNHTLRMLLLLREDDVIHRDLLIRNIFAAGNRPFLIDFAWATPTRVARGYPRGLGRRTPRPHDAYCDAYAVAFELEKCFARRSPLWQPLLSRVKADVACEASTLLSAQALYAQIFNTSSRDARAARTFDAFYARGLAAATNVSSMYARNLRALWVNIARRLPQRQDAPMAVFEIGGGGSGAGYFGSLFAAHYRRAHATIAMGSRNNTRAAAARVRGAERVHACRARLKIATGGVDKALRDFFYNVSRRHCGVDVAFVRQPFLALDTQADAVYGLGEIASSACATFIELPAEAAGAAKSAQTFYAHPFHTQRLLLQAAISRAGMSTTEVYHVGASSAAAASGGGISMWMTLGGDACNIGGEVSCTPREMIDLLCA